MSKKIAMIVEGHGEVHALPKLLAKILAFYGRGHDIFPDKEAKNAGGRETLITKIEKFIKVCLPNQYAGILILIDTEGECPKTVAQNLKNRIMQVGIAIPVVIVCAHCEYEAWFLPNIDILVQKDLLTTSALEKSAKIPDVNIEKKRDVKRWLTIHRPKGLPYDEKTHQPLMTQHINIEQTAQLSRSFRRLIHAVHELIDAIDQQKIIISPSF